MTIAKKIAYAKFAWARVIIISGRGTCDCGDRRMQKPISCFFGLLLALSWAGGCSTRPRAEDSSIVWLEQGLEVKGMKIALGLRDRKKALQGTLEPIAAITKDGEP